MQAGLAELDYLILEASLGCGLRRCCTVIWLEGALRFQFLWEVFPFLGDDNLKFIC